MTANISGHTQEKGMPGTGRPAPSHESIGGFVNLKDFSDRFGIAAIVRRHFGYRKPVSDKQMGGYPVRGALTYMRALDPGTLGLTHLESAKAFEQGRTLASLGSAITPRLIITGIDQRNRDGGNSTAEGIENAGQAIPPVWPQPAVTYPYYVNYEESRAAIEADHDFVPHRYLAGKGQQIWSEPPAVFKGRLVIAVHADYRVSPVLFDLNFEQLVLLYYTDVAKVELADIPFNPGAWVPTMGGGIVYSEDRKVAMEFRPDLTIVE